MNDLEGEICDEELRECGLWNDILSADLDGEEVLLLNIRYYRVSGVAHNLTSLICRDSIGKVSESLFHVRFELVLALVRNRDIDLPHLYEHRQTACVFKIKKVSIRIRQSMAL